MFNSNPFSRAAISNDGDARAFCIDPKGFILNRADTNNSVRDDYSASSCAFSPDPNGSRLAILFPNGIEGGSFNKFILLWDQITRRFQQFNLDPVAQSHTPIGVYFGADNNTLIVVLEVVIYAPALFTQYKFISLDIAQNTTKELLTHTSYPQAVAVSGNKLAIIDWAPTLCIYDIASRQSQYYPISVREGLTKVYGCAFFAPDTIAWVDKIAFRTFNFVTGEKKSYNYGPAGADPSLEYNCHALSSNGQHILFARIKELNQLSPSDARSAPILSERLEICEVGVGKLSLNPSIELNVGQPESMRPGSANNSGSGSPYNISRPPFNQSTERSPLLRHADNNNDQGCCSIL